MSAKRALATSGGTNLANRQTNKQWQQLLLNYSARYTTLSGHNKMAANVRDSRLLALIWPNNK